MNIQNLEKWINEGSDIEFKYKGKDFSITWGELDGKDVISFCEFYKVPQDAETVEELLAFTWNGETVKEIWESLADDDVWH